MHINDIKLATFRNFKSKGILFWLLVRGISSIGPLLVTYIFSQVIKALEVGAPFKYIVSILLTLLVVECIEHLFRIRSKTLIAAHTESILVNIHSDLLVGYTHNIPHRRELIQAIRNYTKAVREFITYLYTSGLQGLVSFAFVPVILFFIDKKVFVLQVVLMILYLIVTYMFSRRYESDYEEFDERREQYFSVLLDTNDTQKEAAAIKSSVLKVENTTFYNWLSLQNLISFMNFVIIAVVAWDVYLGVKQISDLVLIVGYVKESKMFLNEVTGSVEKLLQIQAGADRIVVVSEDASLVTSS